MGTVTTDCWLRIVSPRQDGITNPLRQCTGATHSAWESGTSVDGAGDVLLEHRDGRDGFIRLGAVAGGGGGWCSHSVLQVR
jgi:hypothetical protein